MEEKKLINKQLIKNAISTFITFTILLLIFDILIYERAESLLYKDIDKELKDIANAKSELVINPRTIYILRDEDGEVMNKESLGRLYEDYLNIVTFDSKNLNSIYALKVNNKYNYRGINIQA